MHPLQAPAYLPMTALPMMFRQVPFRAGRAVYRAMAGSPAAPLLKLGIARRVQKALLDRVRAADVLEIVDALGSAGVRIWVAGGWGVDALLGEQTRKHPDLDLVLDLSDEGPAEAILRRLGFERLELEHHYVPRGLMPHRVAMQDVNWRTVELHWVDMRTWPHYWFARLEAEKPEAVIGVDLSEPFARGQIAGRSVPCLSASLQLVSREVYELGASDLHDAALLSTRFKLPRPHYLDDSSPEARQAVR